MTISFRVACMTAAAVSKFSMCHALLVVCFGLVAPGQVAAQVTWIQNPANLHDYALTPPMGWSAAEAYAIANGGHLVTIRSAAEQAWISQTFGGGTLWIGFSDASVEGSWAWTSGEPITYTGWCPGEPNNASDEDFATLGGCWNDAQDTILVSGIIERPLPLASCTTYGSGCGSPAVAITPHAGSRPILGQSQVSDISNAFLGFAAVVWGVTNQSLPLDFIGATGCTLLNGAEMEVGSFCPSTSLSTAQHSLAIPFDLALLGVHAYLQAWTLAPNFNPLGIAMSNGVELVIGGT